MSTLSNIWSVIVKENISGCSCNIDGATAAEVLLRPLLKVNLPPQNVHKLCYDFNSMTYLTTIIYLVLVDQHFYLINSVPGGNLIFLRYKLEQGTNLLYQVRYG